MTAPEFFFVVFSAIVVLSALMVISARNPVHSVLFLILAFFNSAGLFLIAGAEFLALILVIVYVGAVAVLFLFVVMMLNINFTTLRQGMLQAGPVGAVVGGVLLMELVLLLVGYSFVPENAPLLSSVPAPDPDVVTNTRALGQVLYTEYIYLFQLVGMILLLAMVGAIVLTLRSREGVKKQKIGDQIARRREKTIRMVKVKPGEGL